MNVVSHQGREVWAWSSVERVAFSPYLLQCLAFVCNLDLVVVCTQALHGWFFLAGLVWFVIWA